MGKHLVFVYGTLKGKDNNKYLKAGAFTTGKYVMFREGHSYPAVVPIEQAPDHADHLGHVKGELLEVDDDILAQMDSYEGHPGFFERKEINVRLFDPGSHSVDPEGTLAWMYHGPKDVHEYWHPVTPDGGYLTWER